MKYNLTVIDNLDAPRLMAARARRDGTQVRAFPVTPDCMPDLRAGEVMLDLHPITVPPTYRELVDLVCATIRVSHGGEQ